MAYYGLSHPVVAKYDTDKGTYSDGMIIGKAVGTTVTPQYAEGSLYADNSQAEHEKRFSKATVDAETSTLPLKAGQLLFGHKAGTETDATQSEVSGTADQASYVGYGFVGEEVVDGTHSFTACWLHKVLFSEGDDAFQTTGENITFSTQKISGEAMGDKSGNWRTKASFSTEDTAYSWLKTKAGITETTAA